MNTNSLFIPNKCKVGFQKREGTFTGKLGYIIYFDGKVWRKENSWDSWRQHEGKKAYRYSGEVVYGVEPIEFDNVPTEGFVLNKKVGGSHSGWNHRQTYCRVFDPRGWEFEITMENLLFILENSSSYKGKGLDGEFIYSWSGKDLVLLPISAPDYSQSVKFTNHLEEKILAKDLIPGRVYMDRNFKEYTYLGKFDIFLSNYAPNDPGYYGRLPISNGVYDKMRRYVFVDSEGRYETLSGLTRIKSKKSDDLNPNFSDILEKFLNSSFMSKAIGLELVEIPDSFLDDRYAIYGIYPEDINLEDYLLRKKALRLYRREENGIVSFEVSNENYYNIRGEKPKLYSRDEIKSKFRKLARVYENGNKIEIW